MTDPTKIQEISISKDATLIVALKKMDTIKRKLLLVIDNGKYFGLLSIGDIQRAIINNIDLSKSLVVAIRNDHIIGRPGLGMEEVRKMMLNLRAEFMPVISTENDIAEVFFWEDIFGEKEMAPAKQFNLPVIVMAGGMGERLKPLTNVLPKPLIPIGDKSFIEEIFEHFWKHGCTNFYVSVNYKAELIEFYLKGQNLPYSLEFFREEKPMGTAGSLSLIKNKIHQTFIVTNCDILIDQDYSEIIDYHRQNKNEITIVAALKHYPIPYGIIETSENGKLTELKEKPELIFKINSGMYILEPHLLDDVPENTFFHITQLIEKVKNRNGQIGVFPVSEKSWKDIGDWNLYLTEKGQFTK